MKRLRLSALCWFGGKLYLRNPDETLTPLRDETDYARLDALSAAEVESIAENDSEAALISDEEWARAEGRQPVKKQVGLKLDEDVLTWFKVWLRNGYPE